VSCPSPKKIHPRVNPLLHLNVRRGAARERGSVAEHKADIRAEGAERRPVVVAANATCAQGVLVITADGPHHLDGGADGEPEQPFATRFEAHPHAGAGHVRTKSRRQAFEVQRAVHLCPSFSESDILARGGSRRGLPTWRGGLCVDQCGREHRED